MLDNLPLQTFGFAAVTIILMIFAVIAGISVYSGLRFGRSRIIVASMSTIFAVLALSIALHMILVSSKI